jgi:hypothetical protein
VRAGLPLSCLLGLGACGDLPRGVDPYADAVHDFTPGESAGFGQDRLPDVILGGPMGAGDSAGGTDVLSLGRRGSVVVELIDWIAVDGPGDDLVVFENAFVGWIEPGHVEASEDGETWFAWDCDVQTLRGCAGVHPVYASVAEDGLDPLDPDEAGGDPFDLADVGLTEARFLRITDADAAPEGGGYEGITGGFDLDAVAVWNGAE